MADSHGTGGADVPGGDCRAVPKTLSGLTAESVAVCSALDYPDNPPAGGNHYPVWARFQSYSFAVPRGFWVHDLAVQGLIDALPSDPLCTGDPARRVV